MKFMYFILCLMTSSSLLSCYSSRSFSYQLNDTNKAVINRVFTNGSVSCTDGYCWRLTSEINNDHKYELYGSRILFMGIKLKAIKNSNESFKVRIRVTNLGLRYRKVEQPFLEELGSALFIANESKVKEQVLDILKKLQKNQK